MLDNDYKNTAQSTRKFKIFHENEILKSIEKRKAKKYVNKPEIYNNFEQKQLPTHKLSKNKSQSSFSQYQFSSIFEDSHRISPNKNLKKNSRLTSSVKRIRDKNIDSEKKIRNNSIERLIQQCKKINNDIKASDIFISYNKINRDLNHLKNSIERIQEFNGDVHIGLADNLRKSDSILHRHHLSYSEKRKKNHKSFWKFSSNAITARTKRLVDAINANNKIREGSLN